MGGAYGCVEVGIKEHNYEHIRTETDHVIIEYHKEIIVVQVHIHVSRNKHMNYLTRPNRVLRPHLIKESGLGVQVPNHHLS